MHNEQADLACVDSGDWDLLFRAVQERLRQALASAADTAPGRPGAATAHVVALECVEALGRLHRMLAGTRRPGEHAVETMAEDGRRRGGPARRF